jgi:DNA repair exonuclease SbcCD ATPase subunit
MSKLRIRTKKGWIAYPGSFLQQNYGEEIKHGYLLWDIKSAKNHGVSFHELPNPYPFVTIDWQGTVSKTVKEAKKYPSGSRFRIRCQDSIPQKDVKDLSNELRSVKHATEVTYKFEEHVNTNVIQSGDLTIFKEDLHNHEVHMRLLKQYYKDVEISETDWTGMGELVKKYLNSSMSEEDIIRNTKWTIKELSFDNLFAYGESNHISFESLPGITGIFGANRSGKSSVVGTIMYSLFNTTDRGPIKNMFVVNVRKQHGYSKIRIGVDGCDYTVERQTTKHENKRGEEHGTTNLNIFRHNSDGSVDELNGEQRTDSEKTVRKLIGSPEDFMLTSLAAQFDLVRFINEGSTQRKVILSRFLDLDIFDRMHSKVRDDLSGTKLLIKNVPDVHWDAEKRRLKDSIKDCDKIISLCESQLFQQRQKLQEKRTIHASRGGTQVTSKDDVEYQLLVCKKLHNKIQNLESKSKAGSDLISQSHEKLDKIISLKSHHNIDDLKKRLSSQQAIETTVMGIKHEYERELTLLQSQEKSAKKLLEVPCGDAFLTCKFIKDSHQDKLRIASQCVKVEKLLASLSTTQAALNVLKEEKIDEKIKKLEQISELHTKLRLEISNREMDQVRYATELSQITTEYTDEKYRLETLEEALNNSLNSEEVTLRREIESIESQIKELDAKRLTLSNSKGRHESELEKLADEKIRYDELHGRLYKFELIANAFSKRGIPNKIVNSQLPVINSEIAKILHGVTDFTIEMESDVDSNAMEVYINYGDSRRIIELASGMEKTIASLAIRVALLNVTSLPKSDTFIIDEGFGTLDDQQVEACNRLLLSLKKIFRSILVITHVEGIKDVTDNIIEITRNEKDSKVVYR